MFNDDTPPIFTQKQPNPSGLGKNIADPLNEDVLTPQSSVKSILIEGVIVETYPDSYVADVMTSEGMCSGCKMLSAYISPDSGSGEACVPEVGARCLLTFSGPTPLILGYIPESDRAITSLDNSKRTISAGTEQFGGNDSNFKGTGADNGRQGRPTDLIAGDWARISTEGNLIAVLRGLTVLKGSELSQLIMTQLGGLVRLITQNYQHFSSFGDIEIVNREGKTSLIVRGGADQLSQVGKDSGNWTIHLDVGATGDLLDFKITTADQITKAKLQIDPSGNVEVLETSISITIEKDKTEIIKGNSSLELTGTLTETYNAAVTRSVGGTITEEVSGNKDVTVGQNKAEKVIGTETVSIGSNSDKSVSGSVKERIGGGWDVEVNNPAGGSTSTEKIKFWNFTGQVEIGSTLQKVSIKSNTNEVVVSGQTRVVLEGPAIYLGGSTAAFNLVTYEGLRQYLTVLEKWLVGHNHGGGPAVPPLDPLLLAVTNLPKSNIGKISG